ncbi:MAG: transporter substrate-binding domain-containing protein [Methylocystaceae bacterium]|nr:transporter substrate-binding domain-containing protein [Methylocystaceae bacterium]
MAAFKIANVLEPDGTGTYDKLLAEVTQKTGITFNIQVLPIARARESYAQGRFDCLIPLDTVFEARHQDHLTSVPFYEANLYAITRKSDKLVQSIQELQSMTVAGELGVPYTPEIDALIKTNKNPTLAGAVRMLRASRVDAIVAYTPDIQEMIEHDHITDIHFDPNSPIATYHDALTCRPTDTNLELLNKINHALLEIFIAQEQLQN